MENTSFVFKLLSSVFVFCLKLNLPLKRTFLLTLIFPAILCVNAQQTELKYLSGLDKDHTVEWDFFCTSGRNSGEWSKIKVPSNWELQGFGTYLYGKTDTVANEKGIYKYEFLVSKNWEKKVVNIVFEGSMTDTEVKINGKLAGPIQQGAFYRFKYDISKLLKYGGNNTLEVTVSKESSNRSINRAERLADYWVGTVYPSFPDGDISILHGISAIGTKFSKAEEEGPQSRKNVYRNESLKGTLYFKFGE